MPSLNNNQLDDTILVDACPSFAGGQRSYGPPDQLGKTESASLLNIDIRDSAAVTRRGTMALGAALPGSVQGLHWFATPAPEYLVACAGGGLHQWDESSWT